MEKILEGKRVAVLVETEYIPKEIAFYKSFFESRGAVVDFLTYLWDEEEREIISDVTEKEDVPQTMKVTMEIADVNPNDYDFVLCAANYVACRLREIPPMGSLGSADEVRSPAAVQFMANAMKNPRIVKGMLCHALWILTPVPELLRGRKVICHTVVLADVLNAGGIYVPEPMHAVVDKDLVTARSAEDLDIYGEKLLEAYKALSKHSETD
ncbi:MAG: DJ-1/PfpI family protein [Lachnospiraceae bacterium]|nr:DJ-1/PfpI family protein [Lachnospiraceae bacterium]